MLREKRYRGYVWEIIEEAPTKSEIEIGKILELQEEGKTQDEIADALGTSQSTVQRRLSQNTISA